MDDESWLERNFPELQPDDTGRPARNVYLGVGAYMHLHGQGQPDAPRPIP